MSMSDTPWMWSESHGDYYRFIHDENGDKQVQWGRAAVPASNSSEPPQISASPRSMPPRPQRAYRDKTSIESTDSTSSAYLSPYVPDTPPYATQILQGAPSNVGVDDFTSSLNQYTPAGHTQQHQTTWQPGLYTPEGMSYTMPYAPTGVSSYDIAGDPSDVADNSPIRQWSHSLDDKYVRVRNPRAFFKKGRVFMTLVTEPKKFNDMDDETVRYSESVFAKIGRFVVIRPRAKHCLCLPIQTYSGRATSKPGVNADDHAALVREGQRVKYHKDETRLRKEPLQLIVENPDVDISPYSRINFGKVTTVENNVMVRTIGRIHPASLQQLEKYFLDSLGVNNADSEYWPEDGEARGEDSSTEDG